MTSRDIHATGRLTARHIPQREFPPVIPGIYPMGLDARRDALIYVPASYKPPRPASLALMLHGAAGEPAHGLSLLQPYADKKNIILIAPASRKGTWDIIDGDAFGPDVLFINHVLELAFTRFLIDPARTAIGGFSDGASYALSIGLTNGDLFTHVIAFSPGFFHCEQTQGQPAVFISHGVHDRVLPVDPCSRRIVPRLQAQGYELVYQEFDGDHQIPPNISLSAAGWLTDG
jgi:phospholipase/carboxylesterase